uniref:Uncharacterized protein n=1 Tax=Chromera velia CCMP2878 TaxID=1169474 RepID=A0A0G4I644_9ALVE|eukprot:Cvel_11296.t1-p1 / transcript=Cvel_11296.t1 / gene=Cvel_11296 / organism=Chromera_velia_CCMP2878 / gene_product=hypothetical protein / transcript_product=hypothetical protein / location=Cvel_scaffold705:52365-63601(-) / protein_length=233 / sequence_SO=supercontig / SO=protein_coding / is_pseudo=false
MRKYMMVLFYCFNFRAATYVGAVRNSLSCDSRIVFHLKTMCLSVFRSLPSQVLVQDALVWSGLCSSHMGLRPNEETVGDGMKDLVNKPLIDTVTLLAMVVLCCPEVSGSKEYVQSVCFDVVKASLREQNAQNVLSRFSLGGGGALKLGGGMRGQKKAEVPVALIIALLCVSYVLEHANDLEAQTEETNGALPRFAHTLFTMVKTTVSFEKGTEQITAGALLRVLGYNPLKEWS